AIFRRTIDFFAETPSSLRPPKPLVLVTIAGRAPGYDFRRAWKTLTPRYIQLARYAADRGLRLAFEPLHPVLMNVDSFICGLDDAVRLMNEVGEPNFGFVFDVWHLWAQADLLRRTVALAESLFIAHFSDWPIDGPRHVDDRVIPGQGSL